MALTKTARTIISSQSVAASGTLRGNLNLNAVQGGGLLTIKITNGATGPTVQCLASIHVAHSSTLPATGAAGTTWKTIASYGGGLVANNITEYGFPIDPAVMCLQVEFSGHTGQAVTVEAFLSELTTAV